MTEYSPGTVRVWHGKWQGMINIRKGPNSKWQRKTKVLTCYHEPDPEHAGATIEVPLPEPTGRITKAMLKKAEKALKEWRDSIIDESGRLSDPDTTVADYVEFYLDTLEAGKLVEPSTIVPYRNGLRLMKNYGIGAIKLDELAQEDAERWIADMVADERAASSIRKNFNVLHGAIKHAVSTKRLRYDPLVAVRTPKIVNQEPNCLDAENRAKLVSFLDIAQPTRANVGVAIALYTGMREAEVCGLRWKDVDLKSKTIHVRNVIARNGAKFYEKEPKTKSSRRDIPFGEDLECFFKCRLADSKAECKVAGVKFSKDMYVIGTVGDGTGKYMSPHKLWQDWKALANALGLMGVMGRVPSFHDLRHTNATVATHMPGTDLKSVQVNLGHSSIKTTVDIYAGDDPEARRDIAQRTASALRVVPKGADVFQFVTEWPRNGTEG